MFKHKFRGARSGLTKKNMKDWASPNYVGRIRSSLDFEVILEVKTAKNGKPTKRRNIIFAKIIGHGELKFLHAIPTR